MLRTEGVCPPSTNDAHPSVLSFRFDCFNCPRPRVSFETKKGTATMSRQRRLCVPWVSLLLPKQHLALLLAHCSRSNIISSIYHLIPKALKLHPVQGCQLSNARACKLVPYLNEHACSLSRHVGDGILCGMDVVAQPAQNRALRDTRPLFIRRKTSERSSLPTDWQRSTHSHRCRAK